GRMRMRTMNASTTAATASPKPICFTSNRCRNTKLANTDTITTAALVTTPAELTMPPATAVRIGTPRSAAPRIRLTRKTWQSIEAPKRMTKRNRGTRALMKPYDVKSSNDSAQPVWNTSTNAPNAAAAESRLSTTAMTPMTTDRKAATIIANVSSSTSATTIG